jgi:hypothetical protein
MCRRPLRDDLFLAKPDLTPTVLEAVHRRCAFHFIHLVALAEWLMIDDDEANLQAGRWIAFSDELTALVDRPGHVAQLIADLPFADRVAQP